MIFCFSIKELSVRWSLQGRKMETIKGNLGSENLTEITYPNSERSMQDGDGAIQKGKLEGKEFTGRELRWKLKSSSSSAAAVSSSKGATYHSLNNQFESVL